MKIEKPIADIHSHILPGVDDGAEDIWETLEMLRIACREGITDLIVTPHYQSGRYFTPADEITGKVAGIQKLADRNRIPIRLYPGTEIYFRSGLEERMDSGQLATMNGSSFVLVEFSPAEEFPYIRNAMEELLGMGYHPILAHVERFRCMREETFRVRELKSMGCQIQANAGSITGEYGYATKRYLHRLLKEHLVDYVGTDAHNASGRAPHMKRCAEALYRKYGEAYANCILYKNAEKNLLKKSTKEEPRHD
ncbi:MAG: CpsB/CapC family capsule biosynthesis tyrosine phosphatase [Acetatifactor sp.]